MKKVGIIMGSDSDLPIVQKARVMEQAEWIILPQAVEKVSKEMIKRNYTK